MATRECRSILVRDAASEVAHAVLRSHFLTKQELRHIAGDRNLPEHVRSAAEKRLRRDDSGEAAGAPATVLPRGPESIPPASAAADLTDED